MHQLKNHSIVSCIKADKKSINPNKIFDAVKKAMELAHWQEHVKGINIILKVNAMWDKLYPSCTTTPMVVEGVVRTILSSKEFTNAKITIVDANTVSFVNAGRSFKVQGMNKLAEKYAIKIVNLSQTDFKDITFKHATILKKIKISRLLLDADTIITIPVPKTHSYSVITGALKNQWGCIHELRHNYHLVLHAAIVDINKFLSDKLTFSVVDALFAMEGQGPKNGTPRHLGYILASADPVALDTTISQMMGIDPNNINYIKRAEEAGLGKMKPKIVGDPPPTLKFITAQKSNLSMDIEIKLRKIHPLAERLIFGENSPLLLLLRIVAKFYYDFWYLFIGRRRAKKMMHTNFGLIWKKHYLS